MSGVDREAALKALHEAEAALALAEEAAKTLSAEAAAVAAAPEPLIGMAPVLEKELFLPNHLGPVAINGA